MNTSKAAALSIAVSVFCIAAVIWILCGFFSVRPETETTAPADTFSEYGVSGLADSALNVEITVPSANFDVDAVSPFKPSDAKPAAADGAAKHPRFPLRLRGFMKEPPLAILEDGKGETHIKAQGDHIQNIRIIAIENNSVTVRDSGGTFILTVEDNR